MHGSLEQRLMFAFVIWNIFTLLVQIGVKSNIIAFEFGTMIRTKIVALMFETLIHILICNIKLLLKSLPFPGTPTLSNKIQTWNFGFFLRPASRFGRLLLQLHGDLVSLKTKTKKLKNNNFEKIITECADLWDHG